MSSFTHDTDELVAGRQQIEDIAAAYPERIDADVRPGATGPLEEADYQPRPPP